MDHAIERPERASGLENSSGPGGSRPEAPRGPLRLADRRLWLALAVHLAALAMVLGRHFVDPDSHRDGFAGIVLGLDLMLGAWLVAPASPLPSWALRAAAGILGVALAGLGVTVPAAREHLVAAGINLWFYLALTVLLGSSARGWCTSGRAYVAAAIGIAAVLMAAPGWISMR